MFAVAVSKADGFACSLAEVVELCPPCFAASDRPDIDNVRRMQGEDSFDALVIYDSSDSECFADSPASACDYGAGKYLYTLFVALLDAATDVNGIAYFKMGDAFLQARIFDSIKHLGFCHFFGFLFFCHIVSYLVRSS